MYPEMYVTHETDEEKGLLQYQALVYSMPVQCTDIVSDQKYSTFKFPGCFGSSMET